MKTYLFILSTFVCFVACQSAKQHNTSDSDQTPTVQSLEQSGLSDKLKEADVVMVDVRTPGEVADGYIKGASHFIDFYGDDFQEKVKGLDKSKTYVIYCRSGGRSGKAAEFMVENGFKTVYNLEGGISAYSGEVAK
ncbi:MAG: rhodanese-related sulfurtransferase [Bacteroidia bacterium]|jgi:rhodanese-related sulfurtransferase